MPAPKSAVEFIDLLEKSRVAKRAQFSNGFLAKLESAESASAAAALLVKHNALTAFQARLLLAGKYVGLRLGNYVIRDQIGRGGMGTVYLGLQLTLDRQVALKVLNFNKDSDYRVSVERFLREARSAAALNHTNIVRIIDVSSHNDVYFLVMEYVQGKTLDILVGDQGPIPYQQALIYMAYAAAGLHHAYEQGFVHHDIKPDNLIVNGDGIVKILDMGLARCRERPDSLAFYSEHNAVMGTADYIAPEQAMNRPEQDIRCDIYALGGTFFAILAGRPPFNGTTIEKLLQHQTRTPEPIHELVPEVPLELSKIIAKMLAKRPEDRFQTPLEFLYAIQPMLPPEVMDSLDIPKGSSEHFIALSDRLPTPASPTVHMPRSETATDQYSPYLLPVVVAAIVLCLSIACAYIYSIGNAQKGPVNATSYFNSAHAQESASQPETVKDSPKGSVLKPEPESVNLEVVAEPIYQLAYTGRSAKPFVRHSTAEIINPAVPSSKRKVNILKHDGAGTFPKGWDGRVWSEDSIIEFSTAIENEEPALQIHTVEGPGAGWLFSPEIEFPMGKRFVVSIEYRTEHDEGLYPVRLVQVNPTRKPARHVTILPPTNNEWQQFTFILDVQGAETARLEFHNANHAERSSRFWLKGLSVHEASAANLPFLP